MAAQRKARIATVSVLGGKAQRAKTNHRRTPWLKTIADALSERADWGPLNAVLLPGGFFRLKHSIGRLPHAERVAVIEATEIGRSCREASLTLDGFSRGIALVIGLDSAEVSRCFGGDNLAVAWRGGDIIGLARKIFPVDEDTNWDAGPPLRCSASDYASPHRVIELANGSRAVLCACYDLFALRALAIEPGSLLKAVRYLDDENCTHEPPSPELRRKLFESWKDIVLHSDVTVGLACIHEFKRPGRDSYWQRHGIASASAGLEGGLALGAAHFKEGLPSPDASTLAAFGVGRSHLMQGSHRRAHRHPPLTSFLLEGDGRDEPAALVRLYEEGR
jgi:hypothetical protein